MRAIYRTEVAGEAVRVRYAAFLDHWPASCEQSRMATSQGETFVVSSGPEGAPDVLLLHGSSANAAAWMGDVATLAQRFRVHAVDMIGEPGLSAPARPPLTSHVYASWLDEVITELGIAITAVVGISLGGWLALEYATRKPEKVSAMVLLCPGGVGKQWNVLPWVAPLLLLGRWGRRKIIERLSGGASPIADLTPELRAFGEFMDLIFRTFRPRTERLPVFADAELQHLTMPVLAILGAKDVMIDSAETRDRLVRHVVGAEIRWLPEAGHLLVAQTAAIDGFLRKVLLSRTAR